MEYFIISQDDRITNYPEISGVFDKIDRNAIKNAQVQYLDGEPEQFYIKAKGSNRYIDYLDKPIPLISDSFREFLEDYLRASFLKPIIMADPVEMRQELYWLLIPETIECLSDKSEYNKDGTLKRLVIDREKTGYSKVFRVSGIMEGYIIVREDVADKILKEAFTGVKLINVEVV